MAPVDWCDSDLVSVLRGPVHDLFDVSCLTVVWNQFEQFPTVYGFSQAILRPGVLNLDGFVCFFNFSDFLA